MLISIYSFIKSILFTILILNQVVASKNYDVVASDANKREDEIFTILKKIYNNKNGNPSNGLTIQDVELYNIFKTYLSERYDINLTTNRVDKNDDLIDDLKGHQPQRIPWDQFYTQAAENPEWGSAMEEWNEPDSRLPLAWGHGYCDQSICRCNPTPCHEQSFLIEGVPPRLWEIKLQYGIKNLLRDYANHPLIKDYALTSMGWSVKSQLMFGIKMGRYYNGKNGEVNVLERSQLFAIGGGSYDVGLINFSIQRYADPSYWYPEFNWDTQVKCIPGRAGTVDNKVNKLINIRQCRTYHETFNPQPTIRLLTIDLEGPARADYAASEIPVKYDDSWQNDMSRTWEEVHGLEGYGKWRPVDWCLDPFTGMTYVDQNDVYIDFTDMIAYPEGRGQVDTFNVPPANESWFFVTYLLKDEWEGSNQTTLKSDRENGPWLDPRLHTYRSCFDIPIKKSDVLKGKAFNYPPGRNPANGPSSVSERINYPLFNVRLIVKWDTTGQATEAYLSRIKVPGLKQQNATSGPGRNKSRNSIWEDSIISIWNGFGLTNGNNVRPDYGYRHDHGPMTSSPYCTAEGYNEDNLLLSSRSEASYHYGSVSDRTPMTSEFIDNYGFNEMQLSCHDGRAPHCIDKDDYIERTNGYRSNLGSQPTLCALIPLPKAISNPHMTIEDSFKPGRTGSHPDLSSYDKVPATWSKWNGIYEYGRDHYEPMASACIDVRTGRGMRLNYQGGWTMADIDVNPVDDATHGDFWPVDKPSIMGDSPDPVCQEKTSSRNMNECGQFAWPYGSQETWTTPGINCGTKRTSFYQRAKVLDPDLDLNAVENATDNYYNRPNLQWGNFPGPNYIKYKDDGSEIDWSKDEALLWWNWWNSERRYQCYGEKAKDTTKNDYVLNDYKYVQHNAATIATPFRLNFSERRRSRTNCIRYKYNSDVGGPDIPPYTDDYWDIDCEFQERGPSYDEPLPIIYNDDTLDKYDGVEDPSSIDWWINNYEYIETCGFASIFTNLGAFNSESVYSGAHCPAAEIIPETKPWEEMTCYSEVHTDINEFVTPDAGRPHHNIHKKSSMHWESESTNDFVEMYNISSHCYPRYMHPWPLSQHTELISYDKPLKHSPMNLNEDLWYAIRGTSSEDLDGPKQCLDWVERPCIGSAEKRPFCYHEDGDGICWESATPTIANCYLHPRGTPIANGSEQNTINSAHCYYEWFKQLLGEWAVASWIMPFEETEITRLLNLHMLEINKPDGTRRDPDFLIPKHRSNISPDFKHIYMPGLHDIGINGDDNGNFAVVKEKYLDPKLKFCKFDLDEDQAPNGSLWNEQRLYIGIRAGPRNAIYDKGTLNDKNTSSRDYGYLSAWMWQPLIPFPRYDSMTDEDIANGFPVWNERGYGWVQVLDRHHILNQTTWFELCLPVEVQTTDTGNPWVDGIDRQKNCIPLRTSICSNRAKTVAQCAEDQYRVPIIKPVMNSIDPHGFHNPMVVFRLAPDDRQLDLNTVIPMGQTFYYNLNITLEETQYCSEVDWLPWNAISTR